ncbi:MAG: glycosyltransferase family 2 protein [Proteobacteria bacterium]|nr:glycosyltransferase family 2 protein [Pseudomonadota bacterium]
MADVDVSVVTYRPDLAAFASLADALRGEAAGLALHLYVLDNSETDATAALRALPALAPGAGFATVDVVHSAENVGFGRGHNANAARGRSPWLLVLNQDCIVEPGALARLVALATRDDANVAAWEMRQIPYEHPKAYDPVTLDVEWVSGAATLFRRTAFADVGGFDEHLFMYGEDVDLSWRLRARGSRLRYVARCAVVHRTYATPDEVKPLQALGGVRTNLCLRTRYGRPLTVARGLALWAAEVLAPQEFAGRRRGMLKAFTGFVREWPHFRRTRVAPTATFAPHFAVWNYEERREGAFVAFRSLREAPRATTPRVSILIRTVGRTAWLAQALETVAHQTWPNVEAVVVEDGPATSAAVVDAFRDRIAIQYHATGEKVGRARAGNLALAQATGEWFNFLDDDDVLFADHVEVLVEAAGQARCKGAYGIAWETHTEVHDRDRAHYDEVARVTVHRQPFDRLTLWHHNFLPIQAVLFHRSLYEKHGGFAEDMDQLEDWNLWTRYTLDDDFVLVEKTTSKYRVPARSDDAAARQRLLDEAYRDAVARQAAMRLTTSPRAVAQMVDTYARSQSVVLVSRDDVRRFIGGHRMLARAFAWRGPVMRRLRRFGSAR